MEDSAMAERLASSSLDEWAAAAAAERPLAVNSNGSGERAFRGDDGTEGVPGRWAEDAPDTSLRCLGSANEEPVARPMDARSREMDG